MIAQDLFRRGVLHGPSTVVAVVALVALLARPAMMGLRCLLRCHATRN